MTLPSSAFAREHAAHVRRLGAGLLVLAALAAVLLAPAVLSPDAPSAAPPLRPTEAARKDLVLLTRIPSPLEEAEGDLALAIEQAARALADTSSERPRLASVARDRIQELRVALTSAREGGSQAERLQISELNRDLQRLLIELDRTAAG